VAGALNFPLFFSRVGKMIEETPVQEQKISIDKILVPIQEVMVPADFLPAIIPTLQRLRDAPHKFKVLVVTVQKRHAYWKDEHYFLSDGEGLVDIKECTLYYKTRARGRVYKLKISKDALPKELKYYTRGIFVDIKEYEDGIDVLANMRRLVELQGDLTRYDEKNFVVSVLFHLLPHLPFE
jgi:hypothetical protein